MRTMKSLVSLISLVSLVGATFFGCKTPTGLTEADSEVKFFGVDNQRATMVFDSYVEIDKPSETDPDQLDGIYRQAGLDQIEFLFGVFQWHTAFLSGKGIPGGKPVLTVKSTTVVNDGKDGTPSRVRVNYTYTDIVVFEKTYLSQPEKTIQISLPIDPKAIYVKGFPDEKLPNEDDKSKLNPCTHPTYNSTYDFWYFWNPDRQGCPATFKKYLLTVNAKLKTLPNTVTTYPEYNRLGTLESLKFYIVQGPVTDANISTDLGGKVFDDMIDLMMKIGFKEEGSKDKKNRVLVKQQGKRRVELHMAYLNTTSKRDPERKFSAFVKEGMREGDVFLYNGHSGLGGTLPVTRFAIGSDPLVLPEKYQIFMFNGCSSYAYYNLDYFNFKSTDKDPTGTKNLDIITTGLESYFDMNARVVYKLVWHLSHPTQPASWQQVVEEISKVVVEKGFNPKTHSPHFHVNGDEDNPIDYRLVTPQGS